MPPKRTMELFFTAASKRCCQHIENETAGNEGEVVGGVIKMYCSILFSAYHPHFLFRSAASGVRYTNYERENSQE